MQPASPLPSAPIVRLLGLLEVMRETAGPDDVSRLAQALQLELDDLLPLLKAAQILGLAVVRKGDYDLTEAGRRIADAEEKERKALFRAHAQEIPLLRAIMDALAASPEGQVPREQILEIIEYRFSRKAAQRQLDIAIDWGRYAELFDYDADAQYFAKL